MNKSISLKWHFRHSQERVWAFLTDPELLAEWFMENNFLPIKGHEFRITFRRKDGTVGETIDCTVLEIDPPKKLVWSWAPWSNESKDTRVTWTLSPNGDGTDVDLQHNGFINEKDYNAHLEGWPTFEPKLAAAISSVKQ
jgi:uncharacterized protein YndB with AHSA1/START domain